MKVYIVGTGMEGEKTLTAEAMEAIEKADILIGAERMLKPFMNSCKEVFISYRSDYIARKINECVFEAGAVLMSGDCGFFSGTKKLLSALEGHEVVIVPGVSSVSYFCSKLGISYENMKFVTLHGRSSNIAVNVRMNEKCFFLLGGESSARDICQRLCEYGMGDIDVHIGSDLGYETENIIIGKASEFTDITESGLTVLITENKEYLNYLPSAIDDAGFKRSEIPMTKSEVRCIAVSKMDICKDSIVWDIGCGTGSVSVEAAFRCPDGRVFAFDKKREAAELTAENARHFGCDNIIVAEGSCPEILSDAPAPDKVFIGGTAGKMSAVFDSVYTKNPIAEVVVTAVSLETLQAAVDCFDKYSDSPDIVQISVTRTKKLGTHTMLQAQNPVFIISGRLS
ncbi:MAG: precorrin-6y C5,15-methyltransferase (decarboxylating) subunit CbiE [Ruminococcus sp.]|nr:precorrin-6y C5,15-methyltransferase (decarboxylating) subunit CbiE [Ruminococcus sp.]